MRALVLTAALLATVTVAAATETGSGSPRLRPLPLPGPDTEAGLTGMTATGMVHGFVRGRGGPARAAVWRGGRLTLLERTGPSTPTAANDHDQVVGSYTRRPGEEERAVLWTGGRRVDLHPRGAFRSAAVGITDRAEVLVVSHHVSSDTLGTARRLSLWRPGGWRTLVEDGRFHDPVLGAAGDVAVLVDDRALLFPRGRGPGIRLVGLGGGAPVPMGINAGGAVLLACEDDGRGRAALWRDGGLTDLGSLGGGDTRFVGTGPRHGPWLNASGEVTGLSETRDGRYHAFRWRRGVMTDLTPHAPYSTSYAINERGDIAGEVPAPGAAGTHALLWKRRSTTDLGAATPGNLTMPTALHPRLPQVAGMDAAPGSSATSLFTSQ
ncbi:hypothetical protein UO65_5710 [Actinokineospora spheciospongiae]|uniref:Uncharacterized protein n=1 Tax=Actinokineospora spheciospongiae TaxID=909613 RepID=W7IES7_9PSEU|nr:hypothetical protein [Actinokineospora spheciospongiae]EWC59043.1 hypothetical protein UO65_5710 [Actinokineospora spheciospongiae]